MRKSFLIIGLVLALLMAFAMPALGIKIAPYSQPLHDIMHWDARSNKLIIQNPEGESQTIAWPATVDLWNYNGNTWTFDLPTGDKFAFSKGVNINVSTTQGAGTRVQSLRVVDTVGAALGIHEAIYAHVTSTYMTGGWSNAVFGEITYSATGSAGGGMAAAICSQVNMQPAASSGGSYYTYHSYFNFPTSTVLIDSTAFNYAFELYEAAGGAVSCFDDYGEFIRIVGLTDETGHIWYDNTLRIHIGTTDWFIPLSSAEGSYTTAYPIITTREDPLTGYNGIYTTITKSDTYAGSIAGNRTTLTLDGEVNIGNAYAGRFELAQSALPTSQGHTAALYAQVTASGVGHNPTSILTLCRAGDTTGVTMPFINFLDANTNKTTVLMEIGTGNAVGAGTAAVELYDVIAKALDVADITGGLRVKVNGVDWYLLMATPANILD